MQTLHGDGQALYSKLAIAYFNIAKTASYSYTAGTSLGGYVSTSFSQSPASGMSPLVSEVGQALDSVANYMLLAASQAAFLQFFSTASLVMLPIGIFLRSFSFTRKLGGTLLAATIAVVVIYPSSILLSGEVYKTFAPEMKGITADSPEPFANVKVEDAKNPPSAAIVCNPYVQQFVLSPIPYIGGEMGWTIVVCVPLCLIAGPGYAACFESCRQVVNIVFMIVKAAFPVLMYFSILKPFANSMDPGDLISDYYTPLQQFALPAVAKFTVLSLVTFLIPIIITLSLIRNLASTFGGEAQLYGLSKLV
jgi:hypothetical protein